MPKWSDYLATARARGSLGLELFCVVSEPAGDDELIRQTLQDHLAYIGEREAAGDLVFSGPLSDDTGEEMIGMGMNIYRADSFEAARALAAADPMHLTGARTFTLRRWMINEGAFSVQIELSRQTVSLK